MTPFVVAGPTIAVTAAAIPYAGFPVGGHIGTAEARAAAHAESSARLAELLSRMPTIENEGPEDFDWSAIGFGGGL